MKRGKNGADYRVKNKIFPLSVFVLTFLFFGLFTTVQMMVIGGAIDYKSLPAGSVVGVVAFWILGAVAFTLFTRHQINSRYQKPMEHFARAARRVANGDFSVYVPPRHTADKMDYLDVIFTDFNKMVEELGSIETLKTDFFSNVSHEIKTPLSVIHNYAELLKNADGTAKQRQEYADAILQATRRLSSLITNMLKLNKLEKQAIKPMPERFDVSRQLCECALQFEEQWEKKEIDFTVDVEERAMAETDAGLLELVWNNLLSNAFKFTPPGGAVILRQTTVGEEICVTVQDTGCGMTQETAAHVFDKFYQGDASRATEGNGLGLALVQRVLQLLEGRVAVSGTPGRGAVFTVAIPVSPQGTKQDEGIIPKKG